MLTKETRLKRHLEAIRLHCRDINKTLVSMWDERSTKQMEKVEDAMTKLNMFETKLRSIVDMD